MKSYSFQAQIQKHDGMDAAYITFPYDVGKPVKRMEQAITRLTEASE
ncbi:MULTISPECIES: hypothetical protein [unclassified Paenibacillus]|nr:MULTISPECIES: hypothetical protein [unclassified Paenibacillus]MDQ0898737.1 hypothetical protein [Paenibacillus sp. V4I7]MDQ0915272.1 hypothetical protein [Paenibacillus sp. V4I5]